MINNNNNGNKSQSLLSQVILLDTLEISLISLLKRDMSQSLLSQVILLDTVKSAAEVDDWA